MATSRFKTESRARYTSPMPPAPSGDWISYGPSFFPGARAMSACDYNVGAACKVVAPWDASSFTSYTQATGLVKAADHPISYPGIT